MHLFFPNWPEYLGIEFIFKIWSAVIFTRGRCQNRIKIGLLNSDTFVSLKWCMADVQKPSSFRYRVKIPDTSNFYCVHHWTKSNVKFRLCTNKIIKGEWYVQIYFFLFFSPPKSNDFTLTRAKLIWRDE